MPGEDPVAQLEFMAAEGFTALEDNGHARSPGGGSGAHRRRAEPARHEDGRLRRPHDQLEGADADAGRRGKSRRVSRAHPGVGRRREARQREVDDRCAGPRRREAAHRVPGRERGRGAEARLRHSRASRARHGDRAAQHPPRPSRECS